MRDTTSATGTITLTELRERYERAKDNPQQLMLFELDADLSGCTTECGVTDAWENDYE